MNTLTPGTKVWIQATVAECVPGFERVTVKIPAAAGGVAVLTVSRERALSLGDVGGLLKGGAGECVGCGAEPFQVHGDDCPIMMGSVNAPDRAAQPITAGNTPLDEAYEHIGDDIRNLQGAAADCLFWFNGYQAALGGHAPGLPDHKRLVNLVDALGAVLEALA